MFLKKSILSQVDIRFYRGFSFMQSTGVSVSFSIKNNDTSLIAETFYVYLAKVLYCLGNCTEKEMLVNVINAIIIHGIEKDMDISKGANYHLVFLEETASYNKYAKGVYYSNKTMKTKFSYGEENYYASMSVIAFLQHIINTLTVEELKEFEQALLVYLE